MPSALWCLTEVYDNPHAASVETTTVMDDLRAQMFEGLTPESIVSRAQRHDAYAAADRDCVVFLKPMLVIPV